VNDRIIVWKIKLYDRPNYRLEWIDPATQKRVVKGAKTADARIAEDRRSDLEADLNAGRFQRESRVPWKTFRQAYLAEKVATMRPTTRQKAAGVFDSFERLVGPKTMGKITSRTISAYAAALREKGCVAFTVHGHLAYLHAALKWAVGQKFMAELPTFEMPELPKRKFIRKIVAEQFEKLYDKAEGLWKPFVATAWYTGMRRGELLDLTWDDRTRPWVCFQSNRIYLPAAYTKSDEDQWLPLHPQLAEILDALAGPPDRRGRIFRVASTPQETSREFGKLAKSCGLPITLHDLRRSFGSRYAAVVPAPVLQRLMRHASIETTLRFYTDIDDQLDDAILKA
jgi:integrase